jgi:response regulator RpfG family c-di-GMP phosphodiesterase
MSASARERPPRPAAEPAPLPGAQIVPFPPSDRARETQAQPPDAVEPAPQRENVLIVERDGSLHRELKGLDDGAFSLLAARDIAEASAVIEHQPSRVIVFVLDAQSAFERSFLKLLKIEHPGVIVIAVCEALDTPHMIELINHARIFRFLRCPVATPTLVRHLQSAAALARELREQPLLLGTQRVSFDAAESKALFNALRAASSKAPPEVAAAADGAMTRPRWHDRLFGRWKRK